MCTARERTCRAGTLAQLPSRPFALAALAPRSSVWRSLRPMVRRSARPGGTNPASDSSGAPGPLGHQDHPEPLRAAHGHAHARGRSALISGASEDKKEVTAHVGWSGAGINLRTSQPSPSAIAQAVKRVLDERAFGSALVPFGTRPEASSPPWPRAISGSTWSPSAAVHDRRIPHDLGGGWR